MENNERSRGCQSELRWRAWLTVRLVILTYAYFTWLAVWTVLRFLFHDSWSWLFLINSLALYLFLPLPFIVPLAIVLRRRSVWLGFTAALLLWVALYGRVVLPGTIDVQPADKTLTVMTYNAMGSNEDAIPVLEVIRNSGADIVGIGELNLEVAAALERNLAEQYPYQVLYPVDGVEGNGVISRYPLYETGDRLSGDGWIGDPLILAVDFDGTPVTVLQFHAVSLWSSPGTLGLDWSVETREEQARTVAAFVNASEGPIIVLSDLNATDQHHPYRIITSALSDAWREAGRGLGHTFPGANSYFSSHPVLGIPAPKWMIRIDYIFHTTHFRTEAAWLGSWDGLSDHRPVVARLAPVSDKQ